MLKIGYKVTYRNLKTNKLIRTLQYFTDTSPAEVVALTKDELVHSKGNIVARISRQTACYGDVQWYLIRHNGKIIFSRRRVGTSKHREWQRIRKLLAENLSSWR